MSRSSLSSSTQTSETASPGVAGAPGAADAVDVVLRHVRQLEVDHVRQLVDVEAAGGDVGGHQHAHVAALEAGQRPRAGALALVAVDGGGGEAVGLQLLGQAVGAVLGAGEDQHLAPVVGADQMAQQLALAVRSTGCTTWRYGLGGGVARRDLDQLRAVQQPVREVLISSEKVAENSRFWRSAGQQRQHLRMSWMKPMSSIRSASSSTRISTGTGPGCPGRRDPAAGPGSRPGCRRRGAAARSAD
jgi:hypothetical protein